RQSAEVGGDWTRFGYDAARHNAGPKNTGITAANVRRLRRQRVTLPGTVDASPIYLRGVRIHGARHDAFFVTTSYGRTIAIDAASGAILWRFTPRSYSSMAGSYRITNSTPVADPNRKFVYAASPDGRVHKLSVASGAEARGWPVRVTLLPQREKLGTSLNFARGLVLLGTGGYLGDAPPYQGHVVAINAATGRIAHVWNSLCSNVHRLLNPPSCAHSDSAIWARSGVVVAPGSGNLLVATGNGTFDGRRNWGDSALMLTRNAGRLLRNWTPRNYASLESGDVDLGSTAPALIGGFAVQGGKDGKLRLLSLSRLGGRPCCSARRKCERPQHERGPRHLPPALVRAVGAAALPSRPGGAAPTGPAGRARPKASLATPTWRTSGLRPGVRLNPPGGAAPVGPAGRARHTRLPAATRSGSAARAPGGRSPRHGRGAG